MTHSIRWATIALCVSLLGACSNAEDRANTNQPSHQPTTHVFSEQVQSLEKAKNLSRNLKNTEDARQRQFQENGREK